MKTFTIIFCIVLLSFEGNAQIIDSMNSWNYLNQYIPVRKKSADIMGVICENHGFTIGKDTLINSKDYKILFTTITNPYSLDEFKYINGFLRDEENHKKVYFLPTDNSDSLEILLYDFTIMKDSIFTSKYNNEIFSAKVSEVDSIELFGVKRLRIKFADYFGFLPADGSYVNDTTEWIEGIGSNHSFLNEELEYGGLLCFKQNDEMKYFNDYGFKCNYTSDGASVKTDKSQDLSLFPNPLKDGLLSIQSSVPMNTILIFDVRGVKLGEYFPNSTTYELQLNSLKSGVYIINVNNSYRKIIVE